MKVSVILCVYDEERFIDKAISSILNQSLDDFELIVVNDGSTDSTLDIINSYDDDRIRLIDQKNIGLHIVIGRKAVDRINVCLQRRFINSLKLLNQAAVLRKIDTIIFDGASGLMDDCIQFNPHVAGNEVVTEPFFKLFIKISGEQ